MVSVYDLKPAFQRLLNPLVGWLAKNNITPNDITVLALVLSLIGGIVMVVCHSQPWVLLVIPLLLFIRMALNALDGMLARQHQLSTAGGEILNELGDVVADLFLYAPLVLYLPASLFSLIAIGLFVYLGLMSEFCGVLAKAITGIRRYEGPMGKSDRAMLVGLFCLALFFWHDDYYKGGAGIFAAADILLLISMAQRLKGIAKNNGAKA